MLPVVLAVPAVVLSIAVGLAYLFGRLEPSCSERRRRQPAYPLAYELPYWSVGDDGVLVHVDLSYSVILSVRGVDSDCLADPDLEQVHRQLHALLHPLEAGIRLQWMHVNDQDQRERVARCGQVEGAGPGAMLTREKAEAMLAARLRRSRIYLVCSLPPAGVTGASGRLLRRRFPDVTQAAHDEASRQALTLAGQLQSSLASAGLAAEVLAGGPVRALLYELLNPSRASAVPPPRSGGSPAGDELSLRESLVFGGLSERPSSFTLDGRLHRIISLKNLSHRTQPALLEQLTVGLPHACRVQLAVELLDDRKKLDALKRRRDQALALARLRERRNQEAEAQVRDLEELIDEVLVGGNRLVHVAVSVVLAVDGTDRAAEAELERQTADVLRVLSSMDGAEGLVEEYGQLDTWLGSLPGNSGFRSRWLSCTSENAAHLFPAWQSWPGHDEPAILLSNGRDCLLGLDPFEPSLDNPNAFMAGASGSGKSVTTNYLLMHMLSRGARALIVDVGGSYRRLIELFGGEYISLDPGADPAVNLFQPPESVRDADGTFDQLQLDFMLGAASVLIRGSDRGPLTNEERAALDAAIRRLYDHATDAPILGDLFETLRTMPFPDPEDVEIARALSRRLRYWLEGPHARILNRRSTVHASSSLAAFDLHGLPEEVRPAVLVILAGIIWNLVRSETTTRKIVVFDEVWTLLSDPQSQRLIETLYRTSRKHGCSILSISQSVTDFTESEIAGALVQNAATSYLLRHKSGHEEIANVFRLNERERYVFEKLSGKGEMLVLSGKDHRSVARVRLTPLEYWLSTSDPADVRRLQEVRREREGMELLQVLRECASLHPYGVAG